MSSWKQFLYDTLPPTGQDLLLNAYGFATRQRLRRALGRMVEFEDVWRMTRERQTEWVAARLRRILLWAIRTVPFYSHLSYLQRRLEKCPSGEVFTLLEEFPIIDKATVRRAGDSLRSRRYKGRALWCHTSGTTGEPLAVLISKNCWEVADALSWARTLRAGYRWGDWVARLVGDRVVALGSVAPSRPWRISWTDRRVYLSTYHLSPDTIGSFWEGIRRIRNGFIMAYPSALYSLAHLLRREMGTPFLAVKGILYSSEPFLPHQRDVVKSVFSGPFWGYYGMAERVISASTCSAGNYHLHLVDGYLEGQFAANTETGACVATSLRNFAMPLIRYRIGDSISVMQKRCSCGWSAPVIEDVITKDEDILITSSGRMISPSILTWAFKDLSGIRAAQIEQVSERELVVKVEGEKGWAGVRGKELERRLHAMTFGEFSIRVMVVPKVTVESSGKTRFVVRRGGER